MAKKLNIEDKNPWLGFQTYQESDARRFKGRSTDIYELYNLVKNNPIVVCYSDSGIGKSSLINAGLCPLLKKEQLFPVNVMIAEDCLVSMGELDCEQKDGEDLDHSHKSGLLLDTNIIKRIKDTIDVFNETNSKANISIKVEKDQALDDSFNKSMDLSGRLSDSLWWYLHTRVFVMNIGGLEIRITPFLIFDQFEEIFNKAGSLKQIEFFFKRFREISMDTPTAEVLQVYEQTIQTNRNEQKIDIPNANPLKSLFSLRREYMANLDYWTSQKMTFPSFQANKYCLMPLNKEQAMEIITSQQTDVLNSFSEQIIYGLDPQAEAIPSILLSVVCHELFDISLKRNIEDKDLDFGNIVLDAYNKVINDEENGKRFVPVSKIEHLEELLTDSRGKRLQITIEDSWLSEDEYKYLKSNNIIKDTASDKKIELVHDKLAEVVRAKVQIRQSQRFINANVQFNILQRLNLENVLTISGRELIPNYISFGGYDDERQPLMSSITQFRFDYGERKKGNKTDFTSLSQLIDDTNSRYNHVCVSFCDKDGKPCPSLDGIFEIEVVYEKKMIQDYSGELSEKNLITRVAFHDESHSILVNRYGFCGIKLTYDQKGNEIERAYLGKDLKPTTTTKCYSVVKRAYNELNQVMLVKYFDKDMNPCTCWDGNHGYRQYYNVDGQEILRTFFDINEEDTCLRNGIYGQEYRYEEPRGEITMVTNLDRERNPCCDIKGYDRVMYHYDSKGRTNRIAFCDENLNPVVKECGYAISTYGYDDLGQVSCARFYDSNMIPAVSSEEGIYGMVFEYNSSGQPVIIQCIDQFGNPMASKKGYAFISRKFDQIGLELSSKYLDIRRQPTYGVDNIHQTQFCYDKDTKLLTDISLFDEHGKLIQCKEGWARQVWYWDDEGREIIKGEIYDEKSKIPFFTVNNKFITPDTYVRTEEDRSGDVSEAKFIIDFAHRDIYYEQKDRIDEKVHHYCYKYDGVGRQFKQLNMSQNGKPCADSNGVYGIESIYDSEGREIGSAILNKEWNRCKNEYGVSITIKRKASNGVWEEYYDVDGHTPVINQSNNCHKVLIIDGTIVEARGVDDAPCNCSKGYSYIKVWQDEENENVSYMAFYTADNRPVLVEGWHKQKTVKSKKEETLSYHGIGNELVSPYGFSIRHIKTDTGIDIVKQIVYYTDEYGNLCDVPNTELPISINKESEEFSASRWYIRGNGDNAYLYYAYNSKGDRVKGKFIYPYMKYLLWILFVVFLPVLFIVFLFSEYILEPLRKKAPVPLIPERIEEKFLWFKRKPNIQYVSAVVIDKIIDQMPDANSIIENDYVKSFSSIKGLQSNDILLEYGRWKYDYLDPNRSINEFGDYFIKYKDVPKSVTFGRLVEYDNNEIKPTIIRFRASGSIGVELKDKDGLYDKLSVSKLFDYIKDIKDEEFKEVTNAIGYTSKENHIQQCNVYRNIAFIYREDGKYDEAIDYYSKAILLIESLPKYRKLDVSQLYYELSYCYYCMEDYNRSITEIQRAISTISEIREGWFMLSQCKKFLIRCYLNNSQYEEAKSICVDYIDQIEDLVGPDEYADALHHMALILSKLNDWAASKDFEEKAIQTLIDNQIESVKLEQYYSFDSIIHKEIGDILKAEALIRKAISRCQDDSTKYVELLCQYLLCQNKFDEILYTVTNEDDNHLFAKIEKGTRFAILEWCGWNICMNATIESVLKDNVKGKKHLTLWRNGIVEEFETDQDIIGLRIQPQWCGKKTKQDIVEYYLNWLNNNKKR